MSEELTDLKKLDTKQLYRLIINVPELKAAYDSFGGDTNMAETWLQGLAESFVDVLREALGSTQEEVVTIGMRGTGVADE